MSTQVPNGEIIARFKTRQKPESNPVVEAIESALRLANQDDTVLIAGKGHEDYQILGDRRIDFDDRDVAKGAIARLGHGRGPSDTV